MPLNPKSALLAAEVIIEYSTAPSKSSSSILLMVTPFVVSPALKVTSLGTKPSETSVLVSPIVTGADGAVPSLMVKTLSWPSVVMMVCAGLTVMV